MVEIPAALMAAFPPSVDLLLDCSRRRVDDAMLADIARADYGQMADEMMAELRPIRDRGAVADPLPFMLSEVLNLTHYSDPEAPNVPPFEPGPTGFRGHQTRLFACAVLLRAGAEGHDDRGLSTDTVLARCLDSARRLGEEMSEAVACHLTWRASHRQDDRDALFIALGLLILAIRLRRGRLTEPNLGSIASWVLAKEAVDRETFPMHFGPSPPLPFSIQCGFWVPLHVELRGGARSIRDDAIRGDVELCGLLLDPG